MVAKSEIGEVMEETEIVEIPLLLSRFHFRLLENLAEANRCTVAEAVRMLLKDHPVAR